MTGQSKNRCNKPLRQEGSERIGKCPRPCNSPSRRSPEQADMKETCGGKTLFPHSSYWRVSPVDSRILSLPYLLPPVRVCSVSCSYTSNYPVASSTPPTFSPFLTLCTLAFFWHEGIVQGQLLCRPLTHYLEEAQVQLMRVSSCVPRTYISDSLQSPDRIRTYSSPSQCLRGVHSTSPRGCAGWDSTCE